MILCEHKYMGYDFHTYIEKYVGNLYPCQAWIIRKIAGEHDDFLPFYWRPKCAPIAR